MKISNIGSFIRLSIVLLSSYYPLNGQGIDKPQYQIITHRGGSYLGTFQVELFPLIAPLATTNFDSLVNVQFYDSTAFHRVVPGFVIQGGDPNSIHGPVSTWGLGNPNQPNVNAEFNAVRHLRGRLGAARDVDTNSANSQFYICVANATFLDWQYTVYGQVISGMEVVDTIVNSPRDSNDVPLQKIEMFITYTGVNDSVPDAPVLLLPANQSTGINGTTLFQWSYVNDAVMYRIEFSNDSLFSNISFWRESGANSITIANIPGSNTYYWRVKANNGGHESIYSNIFTCTTITAAPEQIYPHDTATGVYTNPVFTWHPAPGATTYLLQVSNSVIFIPPNYVYNQGGLVDTFQQVSGLDPNTNYYWRLRSYDGAQFGYYSPKFLFTTGASAGTEESELPDLKDGELTVFPNPAYDKLHLTLRLGIPDQMLIRLTDLTGVLVMEYQAQSTTAVFTTEMDVSKISKGVYFLSVFTGEKVMKRMVGIY